MWQRRQMHFSVCCILFHSHQWNASLNKNSSSWRTQKQSKLKRTMTKHHFQFGTGNFLFLLALELGDQCSKFLAGRHKSMLYHVTKSQQAVKCATGTLQLILRTSLTVSPSWGAKKAWHLSKQAAPFCHTEKQFFLLPLLGVLHRRRKNEMPGIWSLRRCCQKKSGARENGTKGGDPRLVLGATTSIAQAWLVFQF